MESSFLDHIDAISHSGDRGFMKILTIVTAAALVLFATQSRADAIPYGNMGTVAPTNTFTATATGVVEGYLLHGGTAEGGTAADTDLIEMVDVTAGTNSGWLFDNQTTTPGTEANFGTVTAGDTLEFLLENTTTHEVVSSIPANSPDGINHAYSTTYSGGVVNGSTIPAGTYIGFEDEILPISDLNYNDDAFVFEDLGSSPTAPEPGSLYLLGTGLLVMAGLVRRKLCA